MCLTRVRPSLRNQVRFRGTRRRARLGIGHFQKTQNLHSTTISGAPAWNNNEDFFRFTRSRFLCDEKTELSRRYVKFNVEQLAKIAAEVVGPGKRHCVKVEKLADGLYNKALLMTMDDGVQVIGKVPNPNAGMPHFTTASEVATMDFVRNVLGTPAPRVLSWSSKMNGPVGAEYIIMEKMPGVQLETLWNKIDIKVKVNIMQELAKYQQNWTSTSFAQYGGLYYKRDLSNATSLVYTDKTGKQIIDDRFAVGPSTSRNNNDDGRAGVNFNKGPWMSARDYAEAAGSRERACVTQIAQLPKSPIGLYGPQTYRPSKEKKLQALQAYSAVLEHLLPDDETIQTSHVWHNDLHSENIFVNPENPSEICGMIDWQTTESAPLYNHTIEPYLFEYKGPRMDGDLLKDPNPEEVKEWFEGDTELTPVEKEIRAESLLWKMALVSLWRNALSVGNKRLFRVLEFRQTIRFTLLLFAQNLFLDGEAAYLAILADQYQKGWKDIPGLQSNLKEGFPFTFTAEEIEKIEFDCEGATNGINIMQDVKEAIGSHLFRVDGTVDHEEFENAKKNLRLIKGDFMSKYPENEEQRKEWEASWPFDD